jgi:homeobox protein chox-7
MEEKKETRGAKKGRPKPPGSGRKKTSEPKRNKAFTVRFTEKELEFVNEKLKKTGGSKPDALLKILKYEV